MKWLRVIRSLVFNALALLFLITIMVGFFAEPQWSIGALSVALLAALVAGLIANFELAASRYRPAENHGAKARDGA